MKHSFWITAWSDKLGENERIYFLIKYLKYDDDDDKEKEEEEKIENLATLCRVSWMNACLD